MFVLRIPPGMASSSTRGVACGLLGLVAGIGLGPLFAPDPTGLLAGVLALVVAGVVAGWLYRSEWLRDGQAAT